MIAEQATLVQSDLEHAIRRRIAERTGGRIHALEVEVIDVRVVVRGRAASFHVKQLAIQGVFDVIGADEIEINVLIAVSPPRLDANVDGG